MTTPRARGQSVVVVHIFKTHGVFASLIGTLVTSAGLMAVPDLLHAPQLRGTGEALPSALLWGALVAVNWCGLASSDVACAEFRSPRRMWLIRVALYAWVQCILLAATILLTWLATGTLNLAPAVLRNTSALTAGAVALGRISRPSVAVAVIMAYLSICLFAGIGPNGDVAGWAWPIRSTSNPLTWIIVIATVLGGAFAVGVRPRTGVAAAGR